jgi:hypothetical protein
MRYDTITATNRNPPDPKQNPDQIVDVDEGLVDRQKPSVY